jgi:cytochrome c nitrite reductase small subunit
MVETSMRSKPTMRAASTAAGRAELTVVLGVTCGLLIGLGLFTFGYARGSSYLTNNPAACANCHVMQEQYSGWIKASHRSVAVCNDCHTPPGLVPKYYTKMLNGFFHSLAFTTGEFPDHIQVHARNAAVTEQACRKCHSEMVHAIESIRGGEDSVRCVSCHRDVGHPHF